MQNIVSIIYTPQIRPRINKTFLVDITNLIIDILKISCNTELGIVITNDKTIRELNRTYRNIDSSTDILSFYMQSDEHIDFNSDFIVPPDNIRHLGEVIISYETALRQAKINKITVKEELITLLIHGILHLLNYDHETAKERKIMSKKEKHIMDKIRDNF